MNTMELSVWPVAMRAVATITVAICSLCDQMLTFELNDLCPAYSASWSTCTVV